MRNVISVGDCEVTIDQSEYEDVDDQGNLIVRATGHSTWWCSCGVKGTGQNQTIAQETWKHLGLTEDAQAGTR